jgi:hypothetical protein
MAADGASAARRPRAAYRCTHEPARGRSGISVPSRGVRGAAAGTGLDRRPQRADRLSLGRGRSRPLSRIRGGVGRAGAGRHSVLRRNGRGSIATSDPHGADRVRGVGRSGRPRLGRELGAAGRKRYWLYVERIQPGRKMVGTAQADRAGRDAGSGASGSRLRLWYQRVCRHAGCGAVAQGGVKPGRRARRGAKSSAPSPHSRADRMAA